MLNFFANADKSYYTYVNISTNIFFNRSKSCCTKNVCREKHEIKLLQSNLHQLITKTYQKCYAANCKNIEMKKSKRQKFFFAVLQKLKWSVPRRSVKHTIACWCNFYSVVLHCAIWFYVESSEIILRLAISYCAIS